MKRVKAACVLQTLVFLQREDAGFSKEYASKLNREEVEKYKASLDRAKIRYQIVEEADQPDGSVIVRVRKQYNGTADVSEYFE